METRNLDIKQAIKKAKNGNVVEASNLVFMACRVGLRARNIIEAAEVIGKNRIYFTLKGNDYVTIDY